jgi:hypothetical protein
VTTIDVEVELHELLEWHHLYERFDELLVDKVTEDAYPDLDYDADDPPDMTISEYAITSVGRPNCITFSVKYEVLE